MSDDNVVEIKIVASGTNEAAQDINKVGDAAKNMGGVANEGFEQGKLGALGFRSASHELLGELGLHGPIVRGLSHEVSDLASSFGSGAIALGVVSAAALVTYKIYEHFTEETKKTREELDKSVKSLEGEMKALYDNGLQTDGVTRAHESLLKVKREIYLIDAAARIRLETKELEELNKKQLEGTTGWEKLWTIIKESGGSQMAVDAKVQLAMTEKNTKLIETIHLKEGELKLDQELLKAVQEDGPTKRQAAEAEERRKAAEEEEKIRIKSLQNMRAYTTQFMVEHEKRVKEESDAQQKIADVIIKSENQNSLGGLKASQKKFAEMQNAHSREIAELRKLGANEVQLDVIRENQRTEIARAGAQDRLDLEEKYQEGVMATIGNGINALGEIVGQNNAAMFIMQKGYAIAETYINTAKAAMAAAAAVAGIPVVGPALAAAAEAEMWTLGEINVGLIAATAVGGLATGSYKGAKTGGGGIGVSAVSPVTGLPLQSTNPTGTTGTPSQSVIVNVYGNVMTENELGRLVTSAMQRAQQDNVGI